MAFDSGFLTMMPSTVRVSPHASFNDYGEPTYSTATSYRARIEYGPQVVRNSLGEEVVATATIFLASTTHMSMTAQYEIPDGSGGWSTPEVQTIQVQYDEDGVHHNVVYVGGGGG